MPKSELEKSDYSLNLRVGEMVEVRSAEEILSTLDNAQCVDSLPFMPEMLQFCGKRFRVFKSAHKTSDTIELFRIRRMANAVHLQDLRCDGSSHGGCQAGCLFFWKECWLKRSPGRSTAVEEADSGGAADSPDSTLRPLIQGTRRILDGGQECYRCQATEMLRATTDVRRRERWDPRFYVKDVTSGNVRLPDFIRFGALAMLNAFLLRRFNRRFPRLRGLAGERTPTCELNLQPGEWVRVKSKQEIMKTLNSRLRNRGLWFDVELVPYCGKGPFRVLKRAEKFLNEKTGEMIRPKNACIILEGVTCGGNYSHRRMFSPRHEYHFWHEIWLERVDDNKVPRHP